MNTWFDLNPKSKATQLGKKLSGLAEQPKT